MSGQVSVVTDLTEEDALSPAEPHIAGNKKPEESKNKEESEESTDKEGDDSNEEEEEEEVTSSAHLEPSTLPWPGDKDGPQTDNDDGVWSEERDTGFSGGSQDLSEEHRDMKSSMKSKWRESMPEGEKWRDDELEVQRDDKGEGSLADDEDEEEEEAESNWRSDKAAMGFSPQVTIVRPSSKELLEESRMFIEDDEKELQAEHDAANRFHPEWREPDDKFYLCESLCSEKLKLVLGTAAAALLFPLLVWGGYALIPFESPLLQSTPLRVVYTLRCAFFAIIPIMLGVLVQGVARLRYSALKPLYESALVNREVAVHWHYVNESLALFLFYFLQLAVMATYISQDLVKLVPLLTIIFVFGRSSS
ncbi:transmembrane protein 79-like isoform X2 [Notothenia coriiceps]|uniref:Transmembrane protein 79-like isoform X2 n=1 Tax=Notothenia coriiceps TaxID=8208 RepID=A0A6I9PHH9_9TELE|nr:PREDICTED: transmembrane protein 79-like isoform X2 [Notothenia coriiceps]